MKRLMKFVLVMAMVMMMCGGAMAQSEFIPKGSAIVPNITAERNTPSWTSSHINITNITNSSIQCKVTVYDHDGNETGDLNLYSGSATGVLHIGPIVAPFAIPAHGSRVVSFTVTENYYVQGHAIIEWSSDDPKLYKAIVAGVQRLGANGTVISRTDFLINSGEPF